MSSSCFLPTELCTKFFLSALDLRGGTLLSVTPLQVSWLGSLQDFLCLASCNTKFREYVQQSNFWHGADLELKDRLLVSFRQTAFFGNLLQAWAQGIRTVSCSHSLLHVTSTSIMYWKTEQETCHQASTRARLPSDAHFLVLALRRADYRNTPESSTCMVFQRPFTPAGQVHFRLSNGDRVAIPMPLHLKEGTNPSHTFGFHWESTVLEFSVDDNSIATIPLTVEGSIEPWVRSAAMCLAPPTDFAEPYRSST